MSTDALTWFWFAAGIVMLATELFAPHLVIGFWGLGALIVAALRWLGIIEGLTQSIFVWILSSLVLLIALRNLLRRVIPSERTFQTTDEDVEAVGAVVEVVQQISSTDQNGRIWFAGTSWPAITRRGVIPAGTKARLVLRDNLVWIVEPIGELQAEDDDRTH